MHCPVQPGYRQDHTRISSLVGLFCPVKGHFSEYCVNRLLNLSTRDELAAWHKRSGLPLKKFFNTSGLLYKSLELKDKLPGMSEDEMLQLLATDGMLVKRPLLIGDDFVLVGFKETEWKKCMKTE